MIVHPHNEGYEPPRVACQKTKGILIKRKISICVKEILWYTSGHTQAPNEHPHRKTARHAAVPVTEYCVQAGRAGTSSGPYVAASVRAKFERVQV